MILLLFTIIVGIVGLYDVANEGRILESLYKEGMAHTTNLMEAKSDLQVIRLGKALKFTESTAIASKRTNENSIEVKSITEQGSVKMNEIVSVIKGIVDSSKNVSLIINDLGISSRMIREIVQLITSIVDQTNLLL